MVARLFLDVAKPKSRRNVSSVSSKELNGVDISDLSRWYDSSEIKKLNESQAGRRILSKIMGDKKRHQRHKDKIDKIKHNKRRRIKSVQSTPDEESSVPHPTLLKQTQDIVTLVSHLCTLSQNALSNHLSDVADFLPQGDYSNTRHAESNVASFADIIVMIKVQLLQICQSKELGS